MRIDAGYFGPPAGVAPAAHAARRAGIAGLWVTETGHDPFLASLLASQAEPDLEVGTAIAVGFARSPMTLAQTAWDLAALSRGKFHLGLGSQVKAHVTRRFSMPWGKPVLQMRELILALRTIWKSFETGEKLDFQGEHYKLSLLTPFFTPERHEFSKIPVGLAAVGPQMTHLAGELADFLVGHTFTNRTYLESVTMPAVLAGLAAGSRERSALTLVGSVFVITGDQQGKLATEQAVRRQIAFYGSTPAYAPVLEAIGFGELAVRLHKLSREGQWEEMGRLIPDEVLHQFSLRAEPDELVAAVEERFGGLYDRVMLSLTPDQLSWLKP